MNLNGVYYSKLKGRQIYLPKSISNHLKGNDLYIQKCVIGCLKIYDMEGGIKAMNLLKNMLNPFDEEDEMTLNFYLQMFGVAKISKCQTITLSSDFCAHACLFEEIVLYISNSYIALWSKERYDAYIERKQDPDYIEEPDMMEDIF